jgi:hypothetical protein
MGEKKSQRHNHGIGLFFRERFNGVTAVSEKGDNHDLMVESVALSSLQMWQNRLCLNFSKGKNHQGYDLQAFICASTT